MIKCDQVSCINGNLNISTSIADQLYENSDDNDSQRLNNAKRKRKLKEELDGLHCALKLEHQRNKKNDCRTVVTKQSNIRQTRSAISSDLTSEHPLSNKSHQTLQTKQNTGKELISDESSQIHTTELRRSKRLNSSGWLNIFCTNY